MKCLLITIGIGMLSFGAASPAWAAPDANAEALAESLYREGKRLMAEGQANAACPKFAESFRLSPATGTQLNLAACYQESGKWASAWTSYQAAVAAAARDGRQDRVTYAQEKIAEIEPMLSYVTVRLVQEERPEGLEVSIDGAKVSLQALGIPLPIDPGVHAVDARAPDHEPWQGTLNVEEEKARLTLEIPPLQRKIPEVANVLAIPPAVKEKQTPDPPPMTPVEIEAPRPIPTAVFVAGGITAAVGVGAIVTGALYFSENNKAESASDRSEYDQHHQHAQLMNGLNLGLSIGFGVGVVATSLLYFLRPEAKASSKNSQTPTTSFALADPFLTPWIRRDGAGLSLSFQGELSAPASWELP